MKLAGRCKMTCRGILHRLTWKPRKWNVNMASGTGITRVDVTRGGNWRCHPYFFLKKTVDLFLLITVNFFDFSRVSPSWGCHPRPFSPVWPPRLSTVLCKFSPYFLFECRALEDVTRGAPPPCDATEYGTTKPEIDMYISRWFRYPVGIWFAKIAVITAESRDSLAAILKIDIPTSHWWSCLGELCMPIGIQSDTIHAGAHTKFAQTARTKSVN